MIRIIRRRTNELGGSERLVFTYIPIIFIFSFFGNLIIFIENKQKAKVKGPYNSLRKALPESIKECISHNKGSN